MQASVSEVTLWETRAGERGIRYKWMQQEQGMGWHVELVKTHAGTIIDATTTTPSMSGNGMQKIIIGLRDDGGGEVEGNNAQAGMRGYMPMEYSLCVGSISDLEISP